MSEKESVRRSSRANKGINTKRQEIDLETIVIDEPRSKKAKTESSTTPKKTKSKSNQPAYVPIEGESVRCLPCGTTDLNYDEDEEDPHGMMIECENCNTWQHIQCMFGKKLRQKDIPDNYKCDVCDPLNPAYSNLKRKMAYARYLKLRLHNGSEDEEEDDDVDLKDAGAVDDENDGEYSENGKKVKLRNNSDTIISLESDDNLSADEEDKSGKSKPKKSTNTPTKKKPVKSPKVEKFDEKSHAYKYDTIRAKIIKNLELKLVELLPKTNNEELLRDKTIGELAKEWAELLEKEMHSMFPNYELDHAKYTERARSLLTNLKISRLVDRVISGEFTIEQLPKLTTEEMRTPEEKKKAEEVMQKAIEKVVIKNDVSTLPKTRVTHRGVEIIGDAEYEFNVNDKRNSEVEKIKEEMMKEAEENAADNESEIENNIFTSNDAAAASTDILDDDVFDSILNDGKGAEVAVKEKEKKERAKRHNEEKKAKEHLKLSKLNIWEGDIGSPELSFRCKANFITSTAQNHKNDIENATRMINDGAGANNGYTNKGRLKSRVADEYLDKITSSRDLYLFDVLPAVDDEDSNNRFLKMWSYYHSASRYAVMKNSVSYVKDIYLLVLSREKIMSGEDGAITLNNFPDNALAEHLDQNEREMKLYMVFVAQKNMESIKPVEPPLPPPTSLPVSSANKPNEVASTTTSDATPVADSKKIVIEQEEGDDDYNPALSVTLTKLSDASDAPSDSQHPADSQLESIMKCLR